MKRILLALLKRLYFLFSDKKFLECRFYLEMGKKLDLKKPQTFNEKLQWLKLYDRKPIYTTMVDKVAVKDYVAKIIGEEYIIPTLAVWNSVDEINLDILPDKFVLKTNHGGGNTGVVICHDKANFNLEQAKKRLEKSLKSDIYKTYKEWPYKNVKRKVIAETYMFDYANHNKGGLTDYKFFCFNGYVDCVMVCIDRHLNDTKFYFFDKDWNLLRLNIRGKEAPKEFSLPKPKCMDEMFEIAMQLSKGIPHLRVDLYEVNDKIYFGETTFYSQSGFDSNLLIETDLRFGKLININDI